MVSCLGAAYQKTIAPLHIIAQASDDERHPDEHKLASVVR
jgi:hypothetical protein